MLSCLQQKGKVNNYVKKRIFFSSNKQTLYNKTETSQQNRVCILELLSQESAAGIEQVEKRLFRRYERNNLAQRNIKCFPCTGCQAYIRNKRDKGLGTMLSQIV